jgi:hypothetical protein
MKVRAVQRFWSEIPTGKHRLYQADEVIEATELRRFEDFPDGSAGPLVEPVDEKQAEEYAVWRRNNIGRILREQAEVTARATMFERIKAEAEAKVRAEIEAKVRADLEAEMVPGGKRGAK